MPDSGILFIRTTCVYVVFLMFDFAYLSCFPYYSLPSRARLSWLHVPNGVILLDFSLTVKAATLISISGCGSTISSAKEGKSGFIYNLVNS